MAVYLYAARGSNPTSVEAIEAHLKSYEIPASDIVKVADPSLLEKGLKTKKTTLILSDHEDPIALGLSLKGTVQNVKTAVSQGVNVLALGRAASLVCSAFHLGKKKEKDYASYAPFYQLLGAEAHYPVFEGDAERYQGAKNVRIVSIKTSEGDPFEVYWNEGSYFEILKNDPEAASYESIETFPQAYYCIGEKHRIASISGKYGEGNIVACGFEPHLDPVRVVESIKDNDESKAKEEKPVASAEKSRMKFLHRIFSQVGLGPKK